MLKGNNQGGRPLLACEITRTQVFATRWAEKTTGVEVLQVRTIPGGVSPNLTSQNVSDAGALKSVVADALQASGARTKDVTLIVPDAAVRVALLDFDTLPEKKQEADAVVRFRLKKSLPFEVDRAAISYHAQPNGTTLRVLVCVMLNSVLHEYESAVRDAGFLPGVVLPSTLAALGNVSVDAPTMVVKIADGTTTIAILDQGRLQLYRTLDHGSPDVEPASLAHDIYPSVVFFQDTYGVPIEKIYVSGANNFAAVAPHLAQETAAEIEELDNPVFAGLNPGTLPKSMLAGVLGSGLTKTRINLASEPYEDAKLYLARFGTIAAALLLVAVGLLWFTIHSVRRSSDINRKLSAVRGQIDTLDRERVLAEKMLALPQNHGTVNKSEFLNSVFARKAFSWTTVFSDMEKIMPPGLHVVSIAPELDAQNQLKVQIVVAGENRDRAITLVRNMEQTPRFRDVILRSDIQNTVLGGTSAEDRDPIRFDIVAQYLPSAPNPAPPASGVASKAEDAPSAASAEPKAAEASAGPAPAQPAAQPKPQTVARKAGAQR
ncbi:hypothetical protein Acid345_1577 [Candidatus Koribacter versatilis Ellin345]|uniref:Fimbrial assembly n=1 Tax=Koribacter versatilis (strain Ellin345) TaxID=204669 RepID=Q1IRC1_KORVE|nr:PilN domain-containing protein [Candidatus Koribacter versatilis]ABF40579.1 hypothetical protein Acid345_1577 [Candidatus Koribacter versatilis Ellin345]